MNTSNNNQTTSNSTTQSPQQLLSKALCLIGKIFQAKTGTAINIYNPASFDLKTIEQLAKDAGFVAVYNPTASIYEGKEVPPRLSIAKSKALAEDSVLSFLEDNQ